MNRLVPDAVDNFRERIKTVLNENTLIGHGFVKPYGYPDDFKLIDKIYSFDVNQDTQYKNWDFFSESAWGKCCQEQERLFY